MKKIIFMFLSFYTLSFASITIKGVTFTDYEQNASTYIVSYFPRQFFVDLGYTTTKVSYVLTCRNEDDSTLTCVSNKGLSSTDLLRIRESSYLVDWSLVTNVIGINQRDYMSLMGLLGALFGFAFLFFMVFIFSKSNKRVL